MSKKLVYSVEIDTADAENSVRRVQEQLRILETDTGTAQKEINGLNQELKELADIKIEQSENVSSIGDLRKAYKDLLSLQLEAGAGSEEFTRIAQAAGKLKDRMDEVNDSVRNFNQSPIENLSTSFQNLQGKIKNLDIDGVKQGFRDLTTNIKATAIATLGITPGMTTATIATKAFGAALVATGIGAIVVAIGLLISNFDTLKNSGGILGKTFTAIGNVVESITTSFLKLSDAIGLTSNALDTYNNTKIEKKEVPSITETIQNNLKELEKQYEDLYGEANPLFKFNKESESLIQRLSLVDTKRAVIQKKWFDSYVTINEDLNKTDEERLIQLEANNKAYKKLITNTIQEADLLRGILELRKEQLSDINKNLEKEAKANYAEAIENNKKADKERYDALLKAAEQRKMLRDTEALNAYTTDEKLKLDLQLNDDMYKADRLNIETQFGYNLSQIQYELAKDYVANIEKRKEADNKEAEEYAVLQENVKKSLDQRLSGLDAIYARTKELSELTILERMPGETNEQFDTKNLEFERQQKEALLQLDIQKATERLALLAQYNVDSGIVYDEAVNDKQVAEQKLTNFIIAENNKRLASSIETSKKDKEAKIAGYTQIASGVANLTGKISSLTAQMYANDIARAEGNAARQEELREDAFNANKSLAIVSSIINTAVGVTNALSSSGPPWVGIAMAAIVGAMGAAEVAMIASQQYTPTGGGGSSAAPSLNQGINPASALPDASQTGPDINFVGAGAGANIQTTGGGTPDSISWTGSISVSEINDVQNLVDVYETGSTIGGG